MSTQPANVTPQRTRKRLGGPLSKAERAAAQDVFLDSFAKNANVSAACLKAGIARQTVYQWLEHDEQFSMRYHLAEQDAADYIRAAIQRRGIEGWEVPVVSQGKIVMHNGKLLTERKYSDACLLALAKARVPEFRDRVDVTMQGGVTHEHQHRILEDDPEAAGIARALIRRITSGSEA